jgi:SAM-dependent methyltransferase
VPKDVDWNEYNVGQWGRAPRASLTHALDAVPDTDAGSPGRVAIDLGCGEGVEVLALLEQGWTVHAVDGEGAPLARLAERTMAADVGPADTEPADTDAATTVAGLADRLHVHHVPYADLAELPPADLIHSSYALPYCPPEHFERVWAAVRGALRPGGVLACQLFGPHDDAFGDPDVTFHSADDVRHLLDGLEVVRWVEEDAEGPSFTGPRHWHVFHVVARRPTT